MGRVASTPADYHVEDNESCLTALIDQVRARPNGTLFIRPQGNDWVEVRKEWDHERGCYVDGVHGDIGLLGTLQ